MVNMDSTFLILIFGILACVCFGAAEREAIDLCSHPTGEIVYSNKAYKAWHFISSGCDINGTLNFTYNEISDYFWDLVVGGREIKPTLQISGIPVPLWTNTDTSVSKSVRINNVYGVVMMYDGRNPGVGGFTPATNISYHFDNFGVTTTTQTTTQATTTTSVAIGPYATNESTTYIALTAVFATSNGVSVAVFIYIRRRSKSRSNGTKRNEKAMSVIDTAVVARTVRIEDEYAEVHKPPETKVNELYEMERETTTVQIESTHS